jgi:hypothetical protein
VALRASGFARTLAPKMVFVTKVRLDLAGGTVVCQSFVSHDISYYR